jgi:PAS domain S-box-containing protein
MLFVDRVGGLNRHASQAAGFATVTIAAAALIGWWAGLSLLSNWGSGFEPVKPVTALCLAALGLALMYPGKNSRFAFAVGIAVIAVAALDLFAVDFGVNRWLVPQALGATSFRAINGMPLAITVAGGSLALCRFEGHHFAATALGGLTGVMALFALLTYLTSIDPLYASIRPPALPTVVGVLCVAGGIILRIVTMPKPPEPRPLWHLLTVLGCAIITPLLLFGAYAELSIAGALVRHTQNDLMSEARTLSAEIDREVAGEIERLLALATSPSLGQGNFAEFQRQAEASLALRQSGNIILVDRNMRQFVNTWVPFGAPLPKLGAPGPIERALATGVPQVTDLLMRSVTKQLMFSIIVPVPVDGESRYALIRSPNQHLLAGLVAANELPSGWLAAVSDAAHHIIARSQQENAFIGKELPPAQWPRGGPGGVFEFIDAEGRPSLQAYTSSELTGWQTAVWAPKTMLEAPVLGLWWAIGFTSLLAFALVVAFASWLARIIARSVGHAARAAIGSGEGGMPNQTAVVEINTLMGELRETTALLRQSEATFRAMFDVSSVGKIEVEPGTGRFLRANAAMCEFVGYSEAELLARTVYDITHPDDCDLDREPLPRMLAGELAGFDMEKRYIRKDGKAIWARTTVNAIRDASGRPLRNTGVILDISARKRAEEDLKASKDRLQLALNAAQLGWWQYDPLHRVILVDRRLQEIFDFTADETPIEEFIKRVHPDELERVWADLEAALNPADPKPYSHEYRIRRRDGEVRSVEAHGLAYFEGAGRERRAASLIGTAADITERKEREEREHLLMREINHRAKNMLSVVDAIARQTATRTPEGFIESFSERIQALAANQDLLVRNEWQGVEIDDLVRAQLSPFDDLIGSRVALLGPKLRLNAASSQAIGLALHELVTNAAKYGALSVDRGFVDFSWAVDRDTLTMSWTERDGPLVPAPRRRGFGTIVMEAMAERSVDGTVDLDYAPSGLTWRLACPAANALEPLRL